MQHRKQSPSLPTLLLELKPDSISEKQRKRRSSRTGGLSSAKDPFTNILLFRSVPEERFSIFDWQINMKPLLTVGDIEETPLSPLSPVFSSFTNPFAAREDRRPSTSANRPELPHRSSGQGPSSMVPQAPLPRDRPSALISPSPSLKSIRSDLSSQASSLHPPMGFTPAHPQTYSTLPTDLPSPASTSTGYETQFVEGWTSAQGRSSALSSYTRRSNSIASAAAPPGAIASTPPAPRETILDRAFQMRCIPGSDRINGKDEEKISSIARFEALMREVDERKQARAAASQTPGWELDEESEEESDNDVVVEEEIESELVDDDIEMPTPAQRALDYISGRGIHSIPSQSPTRTPPVPYLNPQAMSAFHGQSIPDSSINSHSRTGSSSRKTKRPSSMALPSRSISTTTSPSHRESTNNNLKAGGTDVREKRRSSTSVKRLSFQEFAKRLSSTSSLLLVQTNASSSSGRDGSRRTSSEYGFEEDRSGPSSERDKRCAWRGSVGVVGGEGGFM
jgi:hypothetical protein